MIRYLVVPLLVAAVAGQSPAQTTPALAPATDSRVYELRTYFAAPGKLDDLHARFRDYTIPLLERHGATNIGYWVPAGNPDNKLIFLLAYPDAGTRAAAWQGLAADPEWTRVKKATEARGHLVDKIEEALLTPTPFSPPVAVAPRDTSRVFEMRTHTVKARDLGKMSDACTRLEKHGTTHVGSWVVGVPRADGDVTVLCLLAHRSEAHRAKAIDGVRRELVNVSADAPEDSFRGVLMANDSKRTVILTPTPYSPLR